MKTRTGCWLVALILVCSAWGSWAQAPESSEKLVRRFLESWTSHDVDKIMSYVSEDCYYANVPSLTGDNPVILGRDNMRSFLAPFFASKPLIVPFKTYTEVKLVVASEDAVAVERVDHFEIAEARFDLPVAGFFKVKDGKITYWVDYFDGPTIQPVGTLMKALARRQEGAKQ